MLAKTRVHSILIFLAAATTGLWIGCDGDEESSGDNVVLATDDGNGSGSNPSDEPEPITCEREGIDIVSTQVRVQEYGLEVRAMTGDEAPIDNLILRLYTGRGTAPSETGVVTLDGVNYKDCGLCPLIMSECTERGACVNVFYASSGEIDITSMSDNRFTAQLKNVVFDQVTVHDSLSIPVEGGDQWCINDFTIDEEYTGAIPANGNPDGGGGGTPSQCDSPNIACVGETLADFSLTNCGTGEQVSMSDHFAGEKAGHFVLTAGWCGACSAWMPQVVAMENNPQMGGYKPAIVLSETPNRDPATQRYCQQYAENYGIPLDMIFIDHRDGRGFATIFENLWPYIGPDGSFGLPFNALIDAESFEYVYGDRGPSGNLSQSLQSLLR